FPTRRPSDLHGAPRCTRVPGVDESAIWSLCDGIDTGDERVTIDAAVVCSGRDRAHHRMHPGADHSEQRPISKRFRIGEIGTLRIAVSGGEDRCAHLLSLTKLK